MILFGAVVADGVSGAEEGSAQEGSTVEDDDAVFAWDNLAAARKWLASL